MAHPRCLAHASPARALHRVLISDLPTAAAPSLGRQTATYLLPPRLFSSYTQLLPITTRQPIPSPPTAAQTRFLSTTPALRRTPTFGQRLTNSNIPYNWVRIADDDGLSEPQPITEVLASLDPKTHTLVMVASPPSSAPESNLTSSDFTSSPSSSSYSDSAAPPAAICRIYDNAAAAAAEAEAELALRRKMVATKELELSWSITPHDLKHKLKKMREFLSKGLAVEVVLAKKRRGRAATKDEAEAVLAAIRAAAAEVEGAKETRKMDGAVGGVAKVFFEGPVEKRKRKKREIEEEAAAAATAGEEVVVGESV